MCAVAGQNDKPRPGDMEQVFRACCFLAICGVSFAAVQTFAVAQYLNYRFNSIHPNVVAEDLLLAKCAQKCMRLYWCLSINYQLNTRTCELNQVRALNTSYLTSSSGWVYSNRTGWPQEIVGDCGSTTCTRSEELCAPSDIGPLCFKGCGYPPTVHNATRSYSFKKIIGSSATYSCVGGTSLLDPTSNLTLTCLGSGKWSPVHFQCV